MAETRAVTWKVNDPRMRGVDLPVVFTPQFVTEERDGATVLPLPVQAVLESGVLSYTELLTTGPGWAWSVSVYAPGERFDFSFPLPSGGTALDLTTVPMIPGGRPYEVWKGDLLNAVARAKGDSIRNPRQDGDDVLVDVVSVDPLSGAETVTPARVGDFRGPQGLPGVNAVPTAEAIEGHIRLPGPVKTTLDGTYARQEGQRDLIIRSPKTDQQDNKRLVIDSYQWQRAGVPNNGPFGEVAHFYLRDSRAKAMLTWVFPVTRNSPTDLRILNGTWGPDDEMPAGSFFKALVWAGAHHWAQDQPDPDSPTVVHAHWSVETPDIYGDLRTRFQVFYKDRNDPSKIGGENALISTNRADFHVVSGQSNGVNWGRFVLEGGQTRDRMVTFAREGQSASITAGDRWQFGLEAGSETSTSTGGDLVIRRFSNSGGLIGVNMRLVRANGRLAWGDGVWDGQLNPDHEAQHGVYWSNANRSGYLAVSGTQMTGDRGAFKAVLRAATEKVIVAHIAGEANARFRVSGDGSMEWGTAGDVADTYLTRAAYRRLSTPHDFVAGTGIRIGAPSSGGGQSRTLAMENVSARPTGTVTNGGYFFAEGGAAFFRGGNGTVTQIAAA